MYGRAKKPDKSKEDDDFYKPKTVSNLWNNNYTEYESNDDRNKNLSLDEYLDKNRHYFRVIIVDLLESDDWKIQLTIVINFISSEDAEEEPIIH